jgi:predicted amidophosphoribosyltransferase
VSVAWSYAGRLRQLVHRAKIDGRPAAVRACAALLPPFTAAPAEALVVVPVPPAPGRRPGPHLATALARAASQQLRRQLVTALRQVRPAAEQHRLSRAERARNVVDLFAARPTPDPVLLVDDLLTSGATASAAAAALRQAGSPEVHLLVLARTPD